MSPDQTAAAATVYTWLAGHLVPSLIVLGIIILIGALRRAALRTRQTQRDPQRLFTVAQRSLGRDLAGGRCEHANLLGVRCHRPGAHGDHIYPWSKGGATIQSNFAWLCAAHNLSKGARVPSALQIRALQRRRRRYYPDGVPVRIDWRIGGAR